MQKIFLLYLGLLISSCSGFNFKKDKTLRKIDSTYELYFIEGYNLYFDTEKDKWHFAVKYANDEYLDIDKDYSVSVLYKDNKNILANCKSVLFFELNCTLNENGQTQFDLVRINNITDNANIKWKNLTNVYKMPINCTLTYKNGYNFEYHSIVKDGIRYEHFTYLVEIEENILPENALVKMDIQYTEKKYVASCTHSMLFLDCYLSCLSTNSYWSAQILPKIQGSIQWLNIDLNSKILIPINGSSSSTNVFDLQFLNNKWNFKYRGCCSIVSSTVKFFTFFTMNVKTEKPNGDINVYLTKCYNISSYSAYYTFDYQCSVEGEGQDKLDLVYLTNTRFYNASIIFTKKDYQIYRSAKFEFIKVYDHFHEYDNNLQILVEDNEDIPYYALVYIDYYSWSGSTYRTYSLECYYDYMMLDCKGISTMSYLYRIMTSAHRGSVTFTNVREKFIEIPRNITLEFKKAHDLFFTDKWNFLITVNCLQNTESDMVIIIDILHNYKETTATCKRLNRDYEYHCVSDFESQSETDTIIIRYKKKYGSVSWKYDITNDKIKIEQAQERSHKALKFYDAFDMYYSNQGKWMLSLKVNDTSQYGGIYKVDLLINKLQGEPIESIAICLLINNILLCKADYSSQDKTDLIMVNKDKSSLSTIEWDWKISTNYPIILKTTLFLKFVYDQIKDNNYSNDYWSFKISINSKSAILPIGSKLVVDYSNSIKVMSTANCSVISDSVLSCKSNKKFYNTNPPYLKTKKSYLSSVTWIIPENYTLISADILYFVESEKKWHFNLTVSPWNNNKAFVDVLYGDKSTLAICHCKERTLHCAIDEENQERGKIIKLSKTSSGNLTVNWTNLSEDISIPLYTELTFDKSGTIKLVDNKWLFNIYVKDEDIPNNTPIILDINVIYHNLTSEPETYYSTVNCVHQNKEIKCELNVEPERAKFIGIEIVKERLEGSKSNVIKWHNADSLSYINLETNAIYAYANKIYQDDKDKYYFDVFIQNIIPLNSHCIIDILIGTNHDISHCISNEFYSLKCEIEENKYITNEIYISKTKTESSTITWTNLNENQILFSIQLEYIHSYYLHSTDGNNLNKNINILLYGDNNLKNDLRLPIKICREKRNNNNKIYSEIIEFIPCIYKNGILFCNIINLGTNEEFHILGEENDIEIINWSNPSNYTYDATIKYDLIFQHFLYCYYDEENNYYIFALKIGNNIDKEKLFVMDLYINDINSYGLCKDKGSNYGIIECHSPKLEKLNNHEIKIKNGLVYGNTQVTGLANDLIIYPNNIVIVPVSIIYDLEFSSNQWTFKIKSSNNVILNEPKQIKILIDNDEGIAICEDSENIILCKVNSASQNDLQLIRIYMTYNSDNTIYLTNLNSYEIPLKAEFELISASDIKYNKEWSFILKVRNNNPDFNIPKGSIFSIDIINYNNNKIELAFCNEEETNINNNNELTLLCTPKNIIKKNELIILSNSVKSEYASVTWNPNISIDNKYIYFNLNLEVEFTHMITYNETDQKWNFYITVKEADIPIDGKITIDIKYNNIDELAICTLKEINLFHCTPMVETQIMNDYISISPIKIKGTASLAPKENLEFKRVFNFVKAYNLKYETKWSFNIKLSNCMIQNGLSILLDIIIDDEKDIANCIYNNNLLTCEVNYEKQDAFNKIQIPNDQTKNDTIVWYNLPKIINLYLHYETDILSFNGGFYGGKWKFNIRHNNTNIVKKIYGNYALLDILVNNKASTAICEITYSSYFKCISNHENQKESDIIKIGVKKEPTLGTVILDNIFPDSNNKINPATFSMLYESNYGYKNENDKLEIIIEGKLQSNMQYDLEEDTVTKIELLKYQNDKKYKYIVSCLTNNIKKDQGSYIYLICPTTLVIDGNKIEIKINSTQYSNYVQFSTSNNIEIKYIN